MKVYHLFVNFNAYESMTYRSYLYLDLYLDPMKRDLKNKKRDQIINDLIVVVRRSYLSDILGDTHIALTVMVQVTESASDAAGQLLPFTLPMVFTHPQNGPSEAHRRSPTVDQKWIHRIAGIHCESAMTFGDVYDRRGGRK